MHTNPEQPLNPMHHQSPLRIADAPAPHSSGQIMHSTMNHTTKDAPMYLLNALNWAARAHANLCLYALEDQQRGWPDQGFQHEPTDSLIPRFIDLSLIHI